MSWTPPAHTPGQDLRAAAPAEAWEAAMRLILDRHGLPAEGLSAEPRGSDVVWSTSSAVVKLTHPRWAQELQGEAWGCRAAAALPVPRVLALGDLEGWPYVVTHRLAGRHVDEVWPTLDPAGRAALAARLGALTAALHALPAPASGPFAPWATFLPAQVAQAADHHARLGAPPALVAQIPDLLARVAPGLLGPEVLLHTELLGTHILLDDAGCPCGLLDFADSRTGHPAYDLGALVDFLFRGQPGLLAAFFQGYGDGPLSPFADDADLLLGAYLVHRFSSLPRLLGGLAAVPGTLADLATSAFRR